MICHQSNLPDPPLPLLVTGVAGVAGFNAFHYFREKYGAEVIGTRPAQTWRLVGPGIVATEIDDETGLARLFDKYQFRSVLNCAGSCALRACELDPWLADRVNIIGVRNLLTRLHGSTTRLVHLSIDLVFSGTRSGNHVETDPTDPVTVYGKTMSVAESMILLGAPDACILRISLPMGISFNGHAGAIDWIQSRFKKGRLATLYFDEVRTPTYVDCLNRVCQVALSSKIRGIHHTGGPRRLSLYQIAQVINRVGGYDPKLLIGCNRIEAGPIPPRAGDVSMNSRKLAAAFGYEPFDPWPVDDELVPQHRHWHFERDSRWAGSFELLCERLYRNPGCADSVTNLILSRGPAALGVRTRLAH
jgi:dTDP-4-dehydrorhamnose reductase